MGYLTYLSGDMRADPRTMLPSAQSIVCVGKLYNMRQPYSTEFQEPGRGWVSRYAWGAIITTCFSACSHGCVPQIGRVHDQPFESKICVDTAPLLERSYARLAGLGWMARTPA